jgi:hypothetical protein
MTHLSVRMPETTNHTATVAPGRRTAPVTTQSFANQLSQTFAQAFLKVRSDPKNMAPAIDNKSSQNSITRQNSVTASIAPVAAQVGFNALVPAATANTTPPAPAAAPAGTGTVQSPEDAYWSKQPAAVQKLRNIDDPGQRAMTAAQLAADGYSIDVPVMVWGWEASKTTQLRQGFGYTWVPSAMQSPVSAAPGISGASIIPYDPAHPPPGSISV